jgi:predicted CXXCH cytochrome family protein
MLAFRRTTVTLLALLALLGIGATWIMAAPGGGFHQGAMACEACHLAGKTVTRDQAHLLVASQENLCGKCHQATAQVSHPSGFLPRIKLPADYPVDWKGDLTCSTCHEVHGKNPGILRGDRSGRELCLSCHDASFFVRMRDQGASLMNSGHLYARTSADNSSLDAYSRQCMECHGGKGDNRAPTIDRNMVVRHGTSSLNHPIGANYVSAAKFGGYRPVATISKKIMLPGGQVSCVSCHEGFTANHGRIVKSERGAGLCYECHDL